MKRFFWRLTFTTLFTGILGSFICFVAHFGFEAILDVWTLPVPIHWLRSFTFGPIEIGLIGIYSGAVPGYLFGRYHQRRLRQMYEDLDIPHYE